MIGTRSNSDWVMLKAVVAALWMTAGATILLVYYVTPANQDIVLNGKMPAADARSFNLANSTAH